MSKPKLFVMITIFAIASTLLVACSGSGKVTSSNMDRPAEPPAQANVAPTNAILNTGENAAKAVPADADANRRWSGEVFLADNDFPDLAQPAMKTTCIVLEDASAPRRYGGCAE